MDIDRPASAPFQGRAFDLLIEGGTVIDGTGGPRRRADVGVAGARIIAVGDLRGEPARRRLDARGLVVAPGFIDAHAHDDVAVFDAAALWPKLSQGVTTLVNGNCGLSAAPLVAASVPQPLDLLGPDAHRFDSFAAYLDAVEAAGPALNAAFLVGHTTLRVACMDELARPATGAECARMRAAVQEALAAGAFGISTGLYYPPARAATAAEVIDVCSPVGTALGVIAAHLRDEADHVIKALDEALDIAEAAGARAVISHHKLLGQANHGRSGETLELLAARGRLQPVCLDCYPYDASSTMLDPARAIAARRVVITGSQAMPEACGQDLDALAQAWGTGRLEAAQRLLPGRAIYFSMTERDVRAVLAFAPTMVGSDGLPYDAMPHPRLWGSFTRVLGHYGRELGLFDLETAVHKMTGLTAAQFGLADRGRIAAGCFADITLFDPDVVGDRATYEQPQQASVGICAVLVNGELALHEGRSTGTRAGRVLRRAGPARG